MQRGTLTGDRAHVIHRRGRMGRSQFDRAQRRLCHKQATDRRSRAAALQRLEQARSEVEAAADLFPSVVVVAIDKALTAVVAAEESLA